MKCWNCGYNYDDKLPLCPTCGQKSKVKTVSEYDQSNEKLCESCGKKIEIKTVKCPHCNALQSSIGSSIDQEKPLIEPVIGQNGSLLVYRDYVEIDRSSSKVFSLMAGLFGKKRLYYSDIGSIQFKKMGLTVGFIQFSVLGGQDSKGIPTGNENAITFGQDNQKWENAYNYVRELLDEYKKRLAQKSTKVPVQNISIVDELSKAADLMERGLISEEEYNKIKDKLLT